MDFCADRIFDRGELHLFVLNDSLHDDWYCIRFEPVSLFFGSKRTGGTKSHHPINCWILCINGPFHDSYHTTPPLLHLPYPPRRIFGDRLFQESGTKEKINQPDGEII